MPEIKNQFTGGRMNKDQDERLVPKGEYRDAMNIQVSTSEGSDVGTAQNILGNLKILGTDINYLDGGVVVGCIADEKIDTLYYLIWSPGGDYIFSYLSGDASARPVFVDINKNVLKFGLTNTITGINVIDGMMFWTDNINEPKKINIARCQAGTTSATLQTKLINEQQGITLSSGVDIEEKHITVIKKTPATALNMELASFRSKNPNKIYTAVMKIGVDDGTGVNNTSFGPTSSRYNFSALTTDAGSNEFTVLLDTGIAQDGTLVALGLINDTSTGLTGWQTPAQIDIAANANVTQGNIPVGTKIVFKAFNDDGSVPGLPVSEFSIKGIVADAYPDTGLTPENTTFAQGIIVKVTSINGTPPSPEAPDTELQYVIDLFDETEKLFEFKFPRFSYRYKYEDGEYSPFAPFTQVAFVPGSFDYHPKKGYNLGMTNKLNTIDLGGFVYPDMPKDVVSVDILFKDEPSPNIYIVDTIRPDDESTSGGSSNLWDTIKAGGYYTIDSETVNSVVPSNQLLRPWDNVPKKALAQDITGSRIVYGNYVQGYDLITDNADKKYLADFNPQWTTFESELSNANKSIKSLREYQLGVVFIDKYGRETPVISNKSGTIPLRKDRGDLNNRLQVSMNGSEVPQELTHYKFFVKETASEYYNMAMDRWYGAQDGNIWLAFPSSDRNKIDIDTFLILKKGTDANDLVDEAARYKVIAIENEAPDYIKTTTTLKSKTPHGGGGTNGANDIFGISTIDAPLVGQDEFKMFFVPFHGTPGQNLDSVEDDLYVQFSKVGSSEVSAKYKIISLTNDWDPSQEVLPTSLGTFDGSIPRYSIQLDRPLEADVNFICDNPADPLNSTQIDNGAIVNMYRGRVENKPQFDGRFFVKIYYDEVFKNNIARTLAGDLEYRVSQSRKIYGLRDDHYARHSTEVNRFLVDNKTTRGGDNTWDGVYISGTYVGGGDPTYADDWIYGYYLDDKFASFALYFRRYMKQGYSQTPNAKKFNYQTGFGIKRTTSFSADEHYYIANLTPGGLDVSYLQDQNQITWQKHPNWRGEIGGHTANHSNLNADFGPHPDSVMPSSAKLAADKLNSPTWCWNTSTLGSTYSSGNAALGAIQFATSFYENGIHDADEPIDTDVWFIDMGPSVRTGTSATQSLKFAEWVTRGKDLDHSPLGADGIYNDGDLSAGSRNGGGVITSGSGTTATWEMEIGFGGIKRVEDLGTGLKTAPIPETLDFFNVGDWNTPTSSASNTNYDSEAEFVQKINIGSQIRWKEDPDKNLYVVSAAPNQINCIRHSKNTHSASHDTNPLYYTDAIHHALMSSNKGIWNDSSFSPHNTVPPGQFNGVAGCKAESLSFNFSQNFKIPSILGELKWDPSTYGEIANGATIRIPAFNAGSGTCIGSTLASDLTIFVETLNDPSGNTNGSLHQGMALQKYTPSSLGAAEGTLNFHLSASNDYLVIRDITPVLSSGNITHYELVLGGYRRPMELLFDHKLASGNLRPLVGSEYKFVQVGVNGYSANSEFNINTMGPDSAIPTGKVGAVSYTLEFLDEVEPLELLSQNPAIFETEPKDSKDLDIYYEATSAIPVNFDQTNIHDAFPIGSFINVGSSISTVTGYLGLNVIVDNSSGIVASTSTATAYYHIVRPDGMELEIEVINVSGNNIAIDTFLYNGNHRLPYHNCYSFGNGVESNRIRDNYNLPFISNGVKASTTLEQEYNQEHRKYGLIYSGLYNSTSGVNNLNQFIQAEKITKDVNPIYGSIQKLHSRDSDLVTLCEDKCLRILANKDAVFNAGGNTNLTATESVLGQTIPFSGEYGISTDPESFATQSYRSYFTDKVRGAVIRLSKDGITPISNHGMRDWFKDNLKLASKIHGSHDDRNDEYNITMLGGVNKTISFKEQNKGWVSFKSFKPESAISMANDYYTFLGGEMWRHHSNKNRNTFYGISPKDDPEAESSVTAILNANPGVIKGFNTLNYEGSQSKVDKFSFVTEIVPFQPNTNYSDQDVYNLNSKDGWYVENIITDKEEGYVSEFIEKEGKWFNNISRSIDINLQQADTADFTFQGIGNVGIILEDARVPDTSSFRLIGEIDETDEADTTKQEDDEITVVIKDYVDAVTKEEVKKEEVKKEEVKKEEVKKEKTVKVVDKKTVVKAVKYKTR